MREQAKSTVPALCIDGAPQPLQWYCLNDTVMGGKSSSQLESTGNGALCFAGCINTDGGGFASCRTVDQLMEVESGSKGVRIAVSSHPSHHNAKFIVAASYKPDGTAPKLGGDAMRPRQRARWESMSPEQQQVAMKDINWQCCLPGLSETDGTTCELFLPFSDFTPSLYGQRLSGLQLDPTTIVRIGLQVGIFDADGKADPQCEAGEFSLSLLSVSFE
jgi:hypothetical protein